MTNSAVYVMYAEQHFCFPKTEAMTQCICALTATSHITLHVQTAEKWYQENIFIMTAMTTAIAENVIIKTMTKE